MSISQFQDIYNEDIIFNKKMKYIVKEYNLVQRSESFFQQLYKKKDGNLLLNINVLKERKISTLFENLCLEEVY